MRSRRIRIIFMSSVFTLRVVIHTVDLIEMFMDSEKFQQNEKLYLGISMGSRIPYLLFFIVAIGLWFHLVRFFVNMK